MRAQRERESERESEREREQNKKALFSEKTHSLVREHTL